MKKSKKFWILSAVLAVALGACTVVYAAGGIFANETQLEAPRDEKISEAEQKIANLQPIAKSGQSRSHPERASWRARNDRA